MVRKRRSDEEGVALPAASEPRAVSAVNDESSLAATDLGGQMEGDADNRRQRALNDYIRAVLRWRQAIEKAETGDTNGIIKLLPITSKKHSKSRVSAPSTSKDIRKANGYCWTTSILSFTFLRRAPASSTTWNGCGAQVSVAMPVT